jgi:N-acetylmuramoyl-L-alanine amidase
VSVSRFVPSLLGIVGGLLLALPVSAAQLESWRFDEGRNRLEFTTDDEVEPRAQLLFNPTRIVIDLPGTTLNTGTLQQSLGGAVREVRVGQFDEQTSRLVIELNPGYTLAPEEIRIQGETSRQWSVQLPTPQRSTPETASAPDQSSDNQVDGRSATGDTQLEAVTATSSGFFLRTRGETPRVSVRRQDEDGQRQIILELPNTTPSLLLRSESLPNNRYSIESWQVSRAESDPSTTLVVLTLGPDSPDWQANATNLGGITLLPSGRSISSIPDQRPDSATASIPPPEPSPSRPSVRPRPAPTPAPPPPGQPAPSPPPASSSPVAPSSRVVVAIDPGHGGRDPGAVGIGGLQEKVVALDISQKVAAILEENGVVVVMTRNDDREVDLPPRVAIAERANANLFVSIHANAISMSRPEVNGVETYYSSAAGQVFAQSVHSAILRDISMTDRGVKSARFYVIRNTSMPAILVETGFVTGATDAPNLANPEWRTRMATAIANGILDHVRRNF